MSNDGFEKLREENAELNEQVKQLFKTEKRLYAAQNELDLQVSRINAVNRFALEANLAREPSQVLKNALDMLCSVFNLGRGIALTPADQGMLRIKASKGFAGLDEVVIAAGDFAGPQAAWFGSPAVHPSASGDASAPELAKCLAHLEEGVRKAGRRDQRIKSELNLLVPLHGRSGDLIALLVTGDDDASRLPFHTPPPSQRDMPFLLLLKAHVESAFENALLSSKLEQFASDLEKRVLERTEQLKLTQERLVQSEKMSAVGQLAAGVAHEINNPLGVILGFAQSLSKKIDPADAGLSLPITSIVREALRCRDLIQQLLTFSRTGKDSMKECDLNVVVQDVLRMLEAQARSRSVQIVMTLQPSLPKVLANPTQMQQVVVNLCSNSIDAMPKGGRLTIETTSPPPSPSAERCVEMSILDTGVGIPEEIRRKIFEPFFTTKDPGRGTGLGLAMVFDIVQRHHGTIDVQSALGAGSSFKVRLPAV